MDSTPGLTLPHIEAALTASGLPFEVWPCDAALADTAAFCAHYGVPPENSVNAILVRRKSELKKVVLCMVLMYQFPGIALWLPDYLFGEWVP